MKKILPIMISLLALTACGTVSQKDSYEQISLFTPAEKEFSEATQSVSELGKELSARLSERGLVFEDLLHEFARIERVRKQLVRMLEVVVTVRKKCHCLIMILFLLMNVVR